MAADALDWLEALDIRRAFSNCHADLYGDWYRDPWQWPEMRWSAKKSPDLIAARLNSDHIARVTPRDVPKANFATRPAIVMDPLDRLIYQALVDYGSIELVGNVQPWAFMGTLQREDPTRGVYPRKFEWENYRDRLKLLVQRYPVVLKTDIVSFFSSVPIDGIVAHIWSRMGGSTVTERLEWMLRRWDAIPNRSGLMQRFVASSALATSYLAPVDDVLHRYSRNVGGAKGWVPPRAVRWMDDIWLFGRDPGRLRRAQLELQDAMRSLDLNMNASKTDVLEGQDAEIEVQQREHSAVEAGLGSAPKDFGAFDELLDRVIAKPERASRTTLNFLSPRMRKERAFGRVSELAAVANRLPQGADALARIFRDSQHWRQMDDWYVEHAGSDWGRIEWSVAQLGTMFPSSEEPPVVSEFFSARLIENTSLQMTAVAAQRLAAWDAPTARAAIRERAAKVDHPLQRRVLALAALTADEEPAWVGSQLAEFEDNRPLLEYLRATNFAKPSVVKDFAAN